MATRPQVLFDISLVQREFRASQGGQKAACQALVQLQAWRPVLDILLDLAVIALALAAAGAGGAPWLPLALLALGNRQRALGNILHDAAHCNLSRCRALNDGLAHGLLAPLLFLDLARYRAVHVRHHLDLGDEEADPDLIPIPLAKDRHWWLAVVRQFCDGHAWAGSAFGHLVDPGTGWRSKSRILAWWALLAGALGAAFGAASAMGAVGTWLLARMTVFHLITMVREMCDHHGLQPGGVFSFARDLTGHGAWQRLIHPRNNAYHLTHHLLPAVPYYRLPQAQRLFATLPSYRLRARVCNRYVRGPAAVVRDWQAPARE